MRIGIVETFGYWHNRRMQRFIIVVVFIITLTGVAAAQETPLKSIKYQLSMSRPVSHFLKVKIIVDPPEQLKDKPLQFQMAKWSPGRYAVFDFAKNVQEFRANAPVTRVNADTWNLSPQGKTTINVSYKVFPNDLSDTFSQLDNRHANYNGGSISMYVVGHKPDPVKLTIQAP